MNPVTMSANRPGCVSSPIWPDRFAARTYFARNELLVPPRNLWRDDFVQMVLSGQHERRRLTIAVGSEIHFLLQRDPAPP